MHACKLTVERLSLFLHGSFGTTILRIELASFERVSFVPKDNTL